ncbi:MAG: helix-turn-helix transcriptional regulator [Candidatus Omnitrophota bacterium]|nr:helix-turn-helix transcriptional regulator [Candidatus Omnitrophota bacterium]
MTSRPFGQTVVLWRSHRHLTQEALARKAGIPRPNLSAIERGQREVTLRTLRALAVGLDVHPGILADGAPPGVREQHLTKLSRAALERIADAAVRGTLLPNEPERLLADALRKIARQRLLAARQQKPPQRRSIREMDEAWLWLAASYPPNVVQSLFQRMADRLWQR